jgi:hypothetical protein
MKARYRERIHAKGRVIIAVGSHVSEGRILDLTVPGCLLESPLSVNKGDSVQLKLFLHGLQSLFSVELAVVRWTNGCRFGVEFLKMNEKDQRQLHQLVAQGRSDRALKKKETRQRFSDPGGHNWHLDTYPLAGKDTGTFPPHLPE